MIHTDSLMEDANLQHINLKAKEQRGGKPYGNLRRRVHGTYEKQRLLPFTCGLAGGLRCLFTFPIGLKDPKPQARGQGRTTQIRDSKSSMLISFNLKESDRQGPPSGLGRRQEKPRDPQQPWLKQTGEKEGRALLAPRRLTSTCLSLPEIHQLSSWPLSSQPKPFHTRALKPQQYPGEKHVPSTFYKTP